MIGKKWVNDIYLSTPEIESIYLLFEITDYINFDDQTKYCIIEQKVGEYLEKMFGEEK